MTNKNMESRIPPVKSDKESGTHIGRMHKKTSEHSESQPPSLAASAPVPSSVEKETEQVVVLPKLFSDGAGSKIDAAMKNQVSSSRAVTVEIDTLRDIMPKLRKEIHTYSINECLLVKELEKKLPSCQEHKDVRLNMVLEEIHRLRMNRRKTLLKLKESIVKVVELRSRMEITSYEAGEIFWDARISKLSGETFRELDIFIPASATGEGEEGDADFSPSRISNPKGDSRTLSISVKNAYAAARTQPSKRIEQEYLTEQTRDPATTYANVNITSNLTQGTVQKNEEYTSPQPWKQSGENRRSLGTEQLSINSAEIAAPIPPTILGQSSPDAKLPIEHYDLADSKAKAISEMGTDPTLDIEKVVSDAQKQALRTRLITRKGILLASIPPAAVAGLLIFDWLTGILSRSLGLPLG
jgi:hypothetical protein